MRECRSARRGGTYNDDTYVDFGLNKVAVGREGRTAS